MSGTIFPPHPKVPAGIAVYISMDQGDTRFAGSEDGWSINAPYSEANPIATDLDPNGWSVDRDGNVGATVTSPSDMRGPFRLFLNVDWMMAYSSYFSDYDDPDNIPMSPPPGGPPTTCE